MTEEEKIVQNIQNKQVKPLYFLMGKEAYFIDRIAEQIETNFLPEEQKSFNQQILYGNDVTVDQIVDSAKRYPLMAEHQVIIVKEAQHLWRTIENLQAYCENPVPTTILVICYKYKSIDKRKKFYKTVKKNGVAFEGKTLYENQVSAWIGNRARAMELQIPPKSVELLAEFLGTDRGKIDNELNKLKMITAPGSQITPEIIEKNIGISKDFNNFELQKAIGQQNVQKAHRIVNYFGQNPKDNPMVLTIGILYNYFSKVLIYHSLAKKDDAASKLGISYNFLSDYATAARNYPMKKISRNIALLREADMKSKGVGANSVSQGDLLKQLLVQLMN